MHRSQILFLSFVLLSGCSTMGFQPLEPQSPTPAYVGLPYDEVALTTPSGTALHAWLIPAQGTAHSTVMVGHNNEDSLRVQLLSIAELPAQGVNVLLVDYSSLAPGTSLPPRGAFIPLRGVSQ